MNHSNTKLITAEELLAMGDIGRCELLHGELVRLSPNGLEHGVIAARIAGHLAGFVEDQDLGLCFATGTGFKIETTPDLVRAPDASFVSKAELHGALPDGFFPGVPDLAVEVVSPDNTKREVAEKVNMWLAHGTAVVWVADPRTMTVAIHQVGQAPQELSVGDEIKDEPLLPEFILPLAKIFKQP
jgi:Uma2 family endonuclease